MHWLGTPLYASSFQGCCNLEVVTVSGKVEEVGQCCFAGRRRLGQATLSGEIRLGKKAFHGCPSLKDIGRPRKLVLCSQSMRMTAVDEFGSAVGIPRIGKEALHASCIRGFGRTVTHGP